MSTFLQEVEKARDAAVAAAEKTIDVIASRGRLAVRFKPPTDDDAIERLDDIKVAYKEGGALSREQEIQLIIDCCDEILRRDNDGELVRVDGGDEPLRFDASDPRWEDKCNDAHECVAQLYNLQVIPLAVSGLADALVDWLQGVDAEVQSRVEGKSEAAEGGDN